MKKSATKAVVKHKSFILSESPIENPATNAVVSALLLMILALNVWTLIYVNEILRNMHF